MKRIGLKWVLVLGLIMVVSFGIAGPSWAQQKAALKLGHWASDPTHPFYVVSVKTVELAKQYSNGRLEIQHFPGGQLGVEQDIMAGARLGVPADIAMCSSNNMEAFAKTASIFGLPYFFKSLEDIQKITIKLWDWYNERSIKEANLRVIAYTSDGFRHLINSKRPVKNLQDLKGLKIRIPKSPTFLAAYRSWGIEPTPMAYAEVFTALQQRVLDGADLPYISIKGVKWYEVQKYITELHFNGALCMMAIGEKSYQGLPSDLQPILIKAGKDATAFAFNYIQDAEKEAKAFLIQKGMQINRLDDEEEWAKRARSTWPQFYDKIGGKEVIEMVQKKLAE